MVKKAQKNAIPKNALSRLDAAAQQKKSDDKVGKAFNTTKKQRTNFNPSDEECALTASAEDFETPEGLKGTYIFVGTQLAAAICLTTYSLQSGDLESLNAGAALIEASTNADNLHFDVGSFYTGVANTVRNGAWLGAHMLVPHAPTIVTAPRRALSNTFLIAGSTLADSQKADKLERVYADKLAENRDKSVEALTRFSLAAAISLPQKGIKPLITVSKYYMYSSAHDLASINKKKTLQRKLCSELADFDHTRDEASISSLLLAPLHQAKNIGTAFNYAAAKGVQGVARSANLITGRKKPIDQLARKLLKKGEAHKNIAEAKLENLKEKFESQMYRDGHHCLINASGALLGTGVHVPQIMMSEEALVQIGAGLAAAGYLKIGLDALYKRQRLGVIFEKAENKNMTYGHKTSQLLVGYAARGEYMKDAFFKWLPLAELGAKGALYVAEGIILKNPALIASGLLFSGSTANEMHEENTAKVKYLLKRWKERKELNERASLNPSYELSDKQQEIHGKVVEKLNPSNAQETESQETQPQKTAPPKQETQLEIT